MVVPVYQTDEQFPEEIQKFGCCFMTILYHLDKELTHEKVLRLFEHCKKNGVLGEECFVQDPQGLCNLYGTAIYKGWARKDYKCSPNEFEQLVYVWKEKEFTHFVAGDGQGNVAYDPINYGGQGSNTVKNGYLESKRIYQWT